MIVHVLNSNNVHVNKINSIDIFIKAFTHKSCCKKEDYDKTILLEAKNKHDNVFGLFDKSYERLEFLGDRVLKTRIPTYLYHRSEESTGGFMTRLQIKLEDKNIALI